MAPTFSCSSATRRPAAIRSSKSLTCICRTRFKHRKWRSLPSKKRQFSPFFLACFHRVPAWVTPFGPATLIRQAQSAREGGGHLHSRFGLVSPVYNPALNRAFFLPDRGAGQRGLPGCISALAGIVSPIGLRDRQLAARGHPYAGVLEPGQNGVPIWAKGSPTVSRSVMRKKKAERLWESWTPQRGSACVSCPRKVNREHKVSRTRGQRFSYWSALAAGAIGSACTTIRVGVSRGQHVQQGRATPARPERTPRRTRATAPAHSKPSCKGAFFLEFDSFIRQNPHKQKRDPVRRSSFAIPLGREEPEFLTARPSWHLIVVSPQGTNHADQLATVPRRHSPPIALSRPKTAIRIIAWSRFTNRLASLHLIGQLVN